MGGIQRLCTVLRGLPADLPAALMAVIHLGDGESYLASILQRCGPLNVVSPKGNEPLVEGKLYVAPPNRHLVVKRNCVLTTKGPRENRHRPAVNTLFRSAARAYRSRVIAVVLSGALDDGSAGALAVKARGGTVVVQDPSDAQAPDMPTNVLRQVQTDYSVPAEQIAPLLAKLVWNSPPIEHIEASPEDCETAAVSSQGREVEPFGFTCPDCGGVLATIEEGNSLQFRCHVGHAYSLDSFSEAHSDALERALWIALRRLNEQRGLHETLAHRSDIEPKLKRRHEENAAAAQNDMKLLHEILARL